MENVSTIQEAIKQVQAQHLEGKDAELALFRNMGLLKAGEGEEVTEEELQTAREALRKQQLAQIEDLKENVSTGLPNAAKVIEGIRTKMSKVPARRAEEDYKNLTMGEREMLAHEEMRKYEEPLSGKSAPVQRVEATRSGGPRLVQLDPVTVLKIELLAARKRANTAEERLALLAIQDARKAKNELEQEEQILMQQITQQLGLPAGKSIRLVDRAKGLCQVE